MEASATEPTANVASEPVTVPSGLVALTRKW